MQRKTFGLICSLLFSNVVDARAGNSLTLPDSVWDMKFESQKLLLAANDDFTNSTTAGSGAASDSKQPSMEEIAEAINNPLSYLWMGVIQNDTIWYSGDLLDKLGEDDKIVNTTLLAPVMSLQLTEDWKMIFRPVIPINSLPTLDCDINLPNPGDCWSPSGGLNLKRKTGLGDIVLWTAFSNSYTPPNIWGFGPTIMLKTATDDRLGTGKWSIGPMALAFHVGEKWIYGAVVQQWWSFAGDDDRDDVSLMDIQYVLRYRYSQKTNIGFGPNIRANWKADSDKRWTVPVGLGGDTMIKLGPLPAKIGIEFYYYVKKPDELGPDWQIRLMFVPVLPAPEWSRQPLF